MLQEGSAGRQSGTQQVFTTGPEGESARGLFGDGGARRRTESSPYNTKMLLHPVLSGKTVTNTLLGPSRAFVQTIMHMMLLTSPNWKCRRTRCSASSTTSPPRRVIDRVIDWQAGRLLRILPDFAVEQSSQFSPSGKLYGHTSAASSLCGCFSAFVSDDRLGVKLTYHHAVERWREDLQHCSTVVLNTSIGANHSAEKFCSYRLAHDMCYTE